MQPMATTVKQPTPLAREAWKLLFELGRKKHGRLEARGLVERRPGQDRRVKTLALTEAGAAVRERVVELMSAPPPEIAGLSAADQRALRDILTRALARETVYYSKSMRTPVLPRERQR